LSKKTKIGYRQWCVAKFGTNLRQDERTPERRDEKYSDNRRECRMSAAATDAHFQSVPLRVHSCAKQQYYF
jgi:hypothetical protein